MRISDSAPVQFPRWRLSQLQSEPTEPPALPPYCLWNKHIFQINKPKVIKILQNSLNKGQKQLLKGKYTETSVIFTPHLKEIQFKLCVITADSNLGRKYEAPHIWFNDHTKPKWADNWWTDWHIHTSPEIHDWQPFNLIYVWSDFTFNKDMEDLWRRAKN